MENNRHPSIWEVLGACLLGALLSAVLFWEHIPAIFR